MEVFERKVVCGMRRRERVSGEGLIFYDDGESQSAHVHSNPSRASDYFTLLYFCRTAINTPSNTSKDEGDDRNVCAVNRSTPLRRVGIGVDQEG